MVVSYMWCSAFVTSSNSGYNIVRSAGCGYSIIWLCGSAIAATASQGHTDILMMAAMYVLVLHSPDVATGKVWWLCVCLLRVRAVIGCWPKDGDIPVADIYCL
jgi:hypothetical protein